MSQKEESKKCSTCGEVKPLLAFHKQGNRLRSACKSCRASGESKKYYEKNAERIKANVYAYKADRKPQEAVYQRQYYLNNIDDLKKKAREYELAHKEELRETHRSWAEKNREHVNAMSRKNSKKYRARQAVHCRQREARKLGAPGSHTLAQVKEIGEYQKWLCACCFVDVSKGYHVDHVMPLTKGGTNFKENLQILCRNCNSKKSNKYPWKFDMAMWVRRLQRCVNG